MTEWKDIIEPEVIDLKFGKFIELSIRSNGKTTGINLSGGMFGLDIDGNKDPEQRYYKSRLYIPLAADIVDAVIAALERTKEHL